MNRFFCGLLCFFVFFICQWVDECSAFSFYKGEDISTDSILLVNTDTDTVVYEKNAGKERGMASLTKIMTYIIVTENTDDIKNEFVEVKQSVLDLVDEDGSVSGLKAGDKITVFDLLHCLMIKSGNDAALVLADYVGKGNIENFVNMMNIKAKDIGCENTSFVNPDGMHDDNHYSTAWDMYKITRYAMNLPYFLEICGKREYKLFDDGRDVLQSTNKMLYPDEKDYYYKYVKGIKTGWHSEAGRCLVSYAEKNGVTYVCVAMGGPEIDINGDNICENLAMIDTKKLYIWAFDNLAIKNIAQKNSPLGQVSLKYAWRKDKLILNPEKDVYMAIPKEIKVEDFKTEYSLPDFVKAPISEGQIVGQVKFYLGSEMFCDANLVSSQGVSFNIFVFIWDKIINILFSKAGIILLVAFVLFFLFRKVYFSKNKSKRRKKKFQNR